jgi:hypothetical protein
MMRKERTSYMESVLFLQNIRENICLFNKIKLSLQPKLLKCDF